MTPRRLRLKVPGVCAVRPAGLQEILDKLVSRMAGYVHITCLG